MTTTILRFSLIFGVVFGQVEGAAPSKRPATPRQRVVKALNTVLPDVEFQQASLPEIVNYLSEQTRVNIIIDPAVYASAEMGPTPEAVLRPRTEPAPGVPIPTEAKAQAAEAAKPMPSPQELGGITIRLKNVPLRVVLKYILRYKNLRYIVDDYAIVIVPIGRALPEEMRMEVFRLRTGGYLEANLPVRPRNRPVSEGVPGSR